MIELKNVLILNAMYIQNSFIEALKEKKELDLFIANTFIIGRAENIIIPEKKIEGQYLQIRADLKIYETNGTIVEGRYHSSSLNNINLYPVISYLSLGLNVMPDSIKLLLLLENNDQNKTEPIRIIPKSDVSNLTNDQIEYHFRLSFAAIQMSDYFHFISRTNGTIYIEIKREIEREKKIVFIGNIFPNYDIQLVSTNMQYEPTRNQVEYLRCIKNDLGIKNEN